MIKENIDYKTRMITLTGVLTAMTVIFTAYILHIPVGANGGYVHFGDAVIYLAAALLPTPYALAVGALGGGIADLLTAPMWTIPTIIIKMLIVLPFTSHGKTLLNKRNLAAPVASFFISSIGYYVAEVIMFGSKTALISALSGSVVQSAGSAVFFYLAAAAFDNKGIKRKLF